MTFTGQSLRAPPGAAPLLTLSPTAREYPYRRSRESEGRSAAGLAQIARLPDGIERHFGMNRDDTDNRQFTLNVMHWLTGLLD
jgi:hypothetical protein